VNTLRQRKKKNLVIKGCSHITGGGFYENVPRMLPENVKAVIRKDSWQAPPVFEMLQRTGDISGQVMYNTFNMGIGMVIALDRADLERALDAVKEAGETAYLIGEVQEGSRSCVLI
jgi:phosphoribosylformylglycinamidine cyclo-ligase